MTFIQDMIIKLIIGNRERLLAMAFAYIGQLWLANKAQVVSSLSEAIGNTPLGATATEEELNAVADCIAAIMVSEEGKALESSLLALARK